MPRNEARRRLRRHLRPLRLGVKRRTVLDRAQGLVLHAVECPVLTEAVLLPFP